MGMMLTGSQLMMSFAGKVLQAPVRISLLEMSIPMLVSAICAIVAVVNYGMMSRHEAWIKKFGNSANTLPELREREEKKAAFAGRNFYIALLGLVMWMVAARLHMFFRRQQLVPVKKTAKRTSLATRITYAVIALIASLCGDIPLCRINYTIQLSSYVTPRRLSLQFRDRGACDGQSIFSASQPCEAFCKEVEELAHERLNTVMAIRSWHIFGKFAAELFDGARGVEQGEQRIRQLFKDKTCAQVLEGVDRSNQSVNFFCWGVTVLMSMVALSFGTAVFSDGPADPGAETNYDPPIPSAPASEDLAGAPGADKKHS